MDNEDLRPIVAQLVHTDNEFRTRLRDALAATSLEEAKQTIRAMLKFPEPEPVEDSCPGCGRLTYDHATVLGLRALVARTLTRRGDNGPQCG
jgi:hypothetical protein